MRFLARWHLLGGLMLFVSILTLSILRPVPVYACSCAPLEDPATELEESAAVFTGKAITIDDPNNGGHGRPVRITFDVDEIWKGPSQARLDITTGSGGGDCGFEFVQNEAYIVYAYVARNDPVTGNGLATSICYGTKLLHAAGEDLAGLGPGMPAPANVSPNASTLVERDASMSPTSAVLLIVGGVAVLVARYIIAVLVRRSMRTA